jgi:hypothetical protein
MLAAKPPRNRRQPVTAGEAVHAIKQAENPPMSVSGIQRQQPPLRRLRARPSRFGNNRRQAWTGGVRLLPVTLAVAFAAIVQWPATALAGATELLIPAYFYPGTGGPGGTGDGWAAMTAAAAHVPLTAIFNPDSGPAPSVDPNYVAAMTNLEQAGGKIVAYVYTNNGNAPLASVAGQISTYISQYGSLIDGFFLDGVLVDPSTLSYYQTLSSYIKGLSPSYTVIDNPGQPFLNEVSPGNYLSTANKFNIFEGTNAGFSAFPYGLNWFQSYPSDDFSDFIYDTPLSALAGDISKATGLGAGSLYITDGSGGDPYAQLPSYWDQEVADLTAVPEPGTLTLLATTLLLGGAMTRYGRRRPVAGSPDALSLPFDEEKA